MFKQLQFDETEIVWTRSCDKGYHSSVGSIHQMTSHCWMVELTGKCTTYCGTLKEAKKHAARMIGR